MPGKSKRRALYEMFDAGDPSSQSVPQTALRRGHMPERAPEPPPEPIIAPRPVREGQGFPLAPGRSIRVPAGYLLFVAAAVVALLIGAYALGHARGERAAETRLALDPSGTSGDAEQDNAIVEPLNANAGTPNRPQGTPNAGGTTPNQRPARTPSGTTPQRTPGGALIVTPSDLDPREPGLNYLIVALRGPDEAVRIAEFLTANAIAAGVFPANRDSLRLVVALRGFSGEEVRNSNDFRRFRQNIRDLGREWAARNRGTQNFDDLYEARHNP
ncbi:MAG: hypothetical protein ACTS3F_13765 [Phycisphaerales bacterium]